MPKKNNNTFSWRDFFTGLMTGALIATLFAVFALPKIVSDNVKMTLEGVTVSAGSESQQSDSSGSNFDVKMYNKNIKEWTVETDDGTSINFYTPAGWYSLADQYNDGLISYYGKELPDDNIVCVGTAEDQYQADMVINARPLSDVDNVLSILYEDEYKSEEMLYSDVYNFMKTGEMPEESESNVTIELVSQVTVNGITFQIYKHGYDTIYYTDETYTTTETVHTDELVAYSDNEDAVEIIMFMAEYNQESGLNFLEEFLGVNK